MRAEAPCPTVGLIAPPWVPVPPPAYGGTEVVVDLLATGLQAAGCEVVLFTTGDATCPVPRRWRYEHALGTTADPGDELPHVVSGYAALSDVDVIHDHTVAGVQRFRRGRAPVPVVTTMHGPMDPIPRRLYRRAADAGMTVVAISEAQRRAAPEVPATVIHHGIDLDRYELGDGGGGYLLFLGRMSPSKGPDRAIRAARAAGRRIVLAAKMWEVDERRYFDEVVEPMLGPDAIFVGEVGGSAKVELLARAEALLNPIRWPEPFGLVMIESLACGTPVVGAPCGAAPEIVDHGRTGFLCTDDAGFVAALSDIATIDRRDCRAAVEERFSAEVMVQAHLALYRQVLDPIRVDATSNG